MSGSISPALGAGVVTAGVAFTAGATVVVGAVVVAVEGTVEVAICGPIVTVKVVDAALPYASAAVQVTAVFPIGNVDPDAGVHVGVSAVPYWSVAVGVVYVSVEPAEVAAAAGST